MEEKNCFKDNLKTLREEMGLGQEDFAKVLHVAKGTISLWESGARVPGMFSLINIARTLKVSVDYLVGLEDWAARDDKDILNNF